MYAMKTVDILAHKKFIERIQNGHNMIASISKPF